MKRTTPWLAAMVLLCPLAAQDPAAKPDAATRLKQLQTEQEEIFATWRKQAQEAAEARKNEQPDPNRKPKVIKAISMRPDYGALRDKYLAAAREFPGEDAVQFLLPALNVGSSPDSYKEVIDLLLNEHLDSPQLGQVGAMLPYLDRMVGADYAAAAIAKIKQHGKNMPLLAWIAFNDHKETLTKEPATSEAFLAAKATVAAALAKGPDEMLQKQFDSMIAEQEKFGIGMVAPDIVGVDLDDVSFKLSDYKGKVVFLDFWGDW